MPKAPRTTGRQKKAGYTPVMQQFIRAKSQYPDAIIFFRMGDFYEMFFDDAPVAAEVLDIALTSRGTGPDGKKIPMAGVPHHAAAGYLATLLSNGFKVAVCEQMAEPSAVKGVVPREVVRVITPGLCLEPDALDARADNVLVALSDQGGLAALEYSTGTLRVCELASDPQVLAEIARLDPVEVLITEPRLKPAIAQLLGPHRPVHLREPASADTVVPEEANAFGEAAKDAVSLVIAYAVANSPSGEPPLTRLSLYKPDDQLRLDDVAVKNLELVRTLRGDKKGALLWLLDKTKTPMGARTLRRRLLAPLTDPAPIARRHDAVEALLLDTPLRETLQEHLAQTGDLERMTTRAQVGLATPRDVGVIRGALAQARAIAKHLRAHQQLTENPLPEIALSDPLVDLSDDLTRTLCDELPATDRVGGIFKTGVDDTLDTHLSDGSKGKDAILALEQRERARTGIQSLKIRYTRVFGYYIEVTRANLAAVPDEYQRKQTVANGERYITEELSALQQQIEEATKSATELQTALFGDLRERVGQHASELRVIAQRLADLDVHASAATVAEHYGHVKPQVNTSLTLTLRDARHPVVEQLSAQQSFVPNDIVLDTDGCRLMLLTGPNMSGKSTTMRQVALSVIMAQAGLFVPAKGATLGIVDRIFTRVGASDDLGGGDSTFMVEMRETATILTEATERSLVIVDEIGRGTSTTDGLAIAHAVLEHLHDVVGCRAIFATHYHSLCDLADSLGHAQNFNVAAAEHEGKVVFLYRVVPGRTDQSYGIQVAELAGVPPVVVAQARQKLQALEAQRAQTSKEAQLPLALASPPKPSPVTQALAEIDVALTTPLQALSILDRLIGMLDRD